MNGGNEPGGLGTPSKKPSFLSQAGSPGLAPVQKWAEPVPRWATQSPPTAEGSQSIGLAKKQSRPLEAHKHQPIPIQKVTGARLLTGSSLGGPTRGAVPCNNSLQLVLHEMGVGPSVCQQPLVCARLDHGSIRHHQDPTRILNQYYAGLVPSIAKL
jgi:hypothetical protein